MSLLPHSRRRESAYLIIEALVYIGLVFVVLGVGFAAMYRCIDNSVALRRNADDITSALQAGERWRADVRAANSNILTETLEGNQVLHLMGARREVLYAFWDSAVLRRVGAGSWVTLLDRVRSSSMTADRRAYVTAWRWELQLEPRGKGPVKPSRVRPLFTFLAVPQTAPVP
jgi:hypothetical protein